MESGRFDSLSRAIGRGATRRQGLGAALWALFGIGAGAASAEGGEGAAAESGGAGAAGCAKHRECATKYCAGGACRCKPNAMACAKGRQCCSGSCVDDRCDGGCEAAGGHCEEQFNCCTGMICRKGVCARSASATCTKATCSGCCDGTTCRAGSDPGACGTEGRTCAVCSGNRPACRDGVCAPCTADDQCSSSAPVCEKGRCVECRGATRCEADDEGCIAAVCTCGSNVTCNGPTSLCCGVLGAVTPVVAPGYRLQMSELRWAPGSSSAAHSHPIAQIACVQSGALGMTLQQGTATVTRGGSDPWPASSETIPLNTEVIIGPRDCIAYDEFDVPTIHTVWNASSGETILWMSDLVDIGPRYTTMA